MGAWAREAQARYQPTERRCNFRGPGPQFNPTCHCNTCCLSRSHRTTSKINGLIVTLITYVLSLQFVQLCDETLVLAIPLSGRRFLIVDPKISTTFAYFLEFAWKRNAVAGLSSRRRRRQFIA